MVNNDYSGECNTCIKINTDKDIFNGIEDVKKLQRLAFDYILNGNTNYEIITDIIDNKVIKFVRISAQEYVYGKQSRLLGESDKNNDGFYLYKMRIVPSIGDLISKSTIRYSSPLRHTSRLFINGFNNFQGELSIDNIFYDINLEYRGKIKEIEQTVPGA